MRSWTIDDVVNHPVAAHEKIKELVVESKQLREAAQAVIDARTGCVKTFWHEMNGLIDVLEQGE